MKLPESGTPTVLTNSVEAPRRMTLSDLQRFAPTPSV